MILHPATAKLLVCPIKSGPFGKEGLLAEYECSAYRCPLWCWFDPDVGPDSVDTGTKYRRGYCGLISRIGEE
jgi:hypothetical protein